VRIGVLTGGGDCPGLNAVIRAVVRKGVEVHAHEFVGFRDGWKGPLEGLTMPLGVEETRGILPRGGTILGSSRTNVLKVENGIERVRDNLAAPASTRSWRSAARTRSASRRSSPPRA
jgi:6-phosphofructokinase 1